MQPNFSVSENIIAESPQAIPYEEYKGPKQIKIKTFGEKEYSPHIVNLKQEEKNLWNGVKTYQEQNYQTEQREALDFSSLIRTQKQKEMEQVRITSPVIGVIPSYLEKPKKIRKEKTKWWFERTKTPKSTPIPKESVSLPKQGFSFLPGQKISFKWQKLSLLGATVFLFVAIPFPAFSYYHKLRANGTKVVEESTNAFLALQSSMVAAMNSDVEQAKFDLNTALSAFSSVETVMTDEHKYLLGFLKFIPLVGDQVESREELLTAGQHLALGNTYLVKGIDDAGKAKDAFFTEKLGIIEDHLKASQTQYKEALSSLQNVNSAVLPDEYQKTFVDFTGLFETFVGDISDLTDLLHTFKTAFGHDDFRRYLVVFQNQNELRATGGFMGGYAILDVQRGKILNIEIPSGGTYDVQGQLETDIIPPLPLQLANKRWELQDANWFPDFPASAKKISWFYQETRDTSIDGVIAVNASVLERVLKVMGEVELEKYGMKVNSENVLALVQEQVEETNPESGEKPKAILGVLFEELMKRSSEIDTKSMINLVTEMHGALRQKEIQAYFKDNTVQKQVERFGWDGGIEQQLLDQDYLYVVNTNINGGKSDAKIEQAIFHEATVQPDGSVLNKVTIRRKHNGVNGEKYYGVGNIDYIRVYVPEGSELMNAGGFVYPEEDWFMSPKVGAVTDGDLVLNEREEKIHKASGTRITKEFGKTVFANWLITLPGDTEEIYFEYRLPFFLQKKTVPLKNFEKWRDQLTGQLHKRATKYSLYYQKQSGIESTFKSTVFYPENWSPVWISSSDVQVEENFLFYKDTVDSDKIYGAVFEEIPLES
ncbi:MAG: DUF4012 domain-containing protein [Candidatus Magasanikbacteria bacterium]